MGVLEEKKDASMVRSLLPISQGAGDPLTGGGQHDELGKYLLFLQINLPRISKLLYLCPTEHTNLIRTAVSSITNHSC